MNKIKEIIYKVRLNSIDRKLTKNAEEMREHLDGSYTLNEDYFENNHIYIEQLRLMSCRAYLENKLSQMTN
jgi:hypothetical protein